MRIHLSTLGCRLNQSEIDSLARQFARQGHEIVEAARSAELFVVNTCAVTQEATRSSRQLIYQLHRANPRAQIAVTGCYAHIAPREAAALPGVTLVVDNFAKESLVSVVTGQTLAPVEAHDHEPIVREPLPGVSGRTRAFIKIQDGCDRKCSFCVTRLARGKGRSRAAGEIVQEIRQLHALGYQEAVLTGVHLGSYGHDLGQPEGLCALIRLILDQTGIPRIRLSSLEPWGITPGFFALWDDPRLCRHLHLPLQSGCDATLRRMIRRTSQAEFRALVGATRQRVPDMAITTDVIVGFPGETDEEFAISRAFIEEMDFAGTHVFRYSQRPGTAAARLPNPVSEDVKKARSDQLQTIDQDGRRRFAERFVGQVMPVLWEAVGGATGEGFINGGYTSNYLRVRCIVPDVLTNRIGGARLTGYDADNAVMHGTPVEVTHER
jgi:threonylcarbamoyladenosine tRNA methylthiotransferase MtaB